MLPDWLGMTFKRRLIGLLARAKLDMGSEVGAMSIPW